jgi:hypothetical protein
MAARAAAGKLPAASELPAAAIAEPLRLGRCAALAPGRPGPSAALSRNFIGKFKKMKAFASESGPPADGDSTVTVAPWLSVHDELASHSHNVVKVIPPQSHPTIAC